MKQSKKRKTAYRIIALIAAMIFLCQMGTVTAFAAGGGAIAGSSIAQGTQRLAEDATSLLMALLPIVVGGVIIYCAIRMSAAPDENDKKVWSNKIKTALFCLVFGECATVVIKIIMSYYGSGSV